MTLENINTIAQTIAALAVLVSLIFVGVQLRQNTRAIRASAGFEGTHSWATLNEQILQLPDAQLMPMLQAFDPEKTLDDFSEIEQVRISTVQLALFQKLEGLYFLYKYGSVDAALWETRRQWAGGAIKLPVLRQWWAIQKAQSIWTEEFVAVIETARDASTLKPWAPPGVGSSGQAPSDNPQGGASPP